MILGFHPIQNEDFKNLDFGFYSDRAQGGGFWDFILFKIPGSPFEGDKCK